MLRWVTWALAACTLALLAGCSGGGGGGGSALSAEGEEATRAGTIFSGRMVVLAYNDLGMHCMNKDFSRFMVLPPANTLQATVIDKSGEEPKIVRSGITVSYSVPGNTRSDNKTNFWSYTTALFGRSLAPNVGLTGNKLSGVMKPPSGERSDWEATAIPITPITDAGVENPYQLATVTVKKNTTVVARTQAVIPVSWEMSCNLCHTTSGISVEQDILRDHDRLHGTTLDRQSSTAPITCGSCHAQAPLALPGKAGVPSLSSAMHGAHASRMASVTSQLNGVSCYACHPGVRTQCQRDIHSQKGMTCVSCHQSMEAVANPSRRPWVDEPRCGSCHARKEFAFEQSGKLFRESKGHHGVQCAACHGSPHAITPTTQQNDNLQAIALQGHAGPIDTCIVCHPKQPEGKFEHHN